MALSSDAGSRCRKGMPGCGCGWVAWGKFCTTAAHEDNLAQAHSHPSNPLSHTYTHTHTHTHKGTHLLAPLLETLRAATCSITFLWLSWCSCSMYVFVLPFRSSTCVKKAARTDQPPGQCYGNPKCGLCPVSPGCLRLGCKTSNYSKEHSAVSS
eukprot:1151459-Pelagomonas_calceolata.AAC.4